MPVKILYSLLYSPLLFLFRLLSFFNPKVRRGFALRQKINGQKPWLLGEAQSKPIWFHCSSGEYEYAKPVIREIKKKWPEQKVLVTYFSPSVEPALKKADDVDFFCPTPWDSKQEWQKFIEHHQPQALLIARTDLWPHMVESAKKANVPRLLFSKTFNKSKGFLSQWLSYHLMKKLDDVFCVSEEDRGQVLKRVKPYQRVHAAGDTRYDQCLYRLQQGQPLKPLNNFNKPIFIVGSSWPSDEMVVLPTIKETINEVSFIIAPHEPNEKHLRALEQQLRAKGLESQRYSKIQSWDPQAVLLIDQVGLLADLYGWGKFAFVGGSMDRSVHSVMEPLAHGLLTFVGPHHENNREALTFNQTSIEDMTPVQVIKDSDEFLRRFTTLAPSWSDSHQFKLKLAVQKKTGASQIVVKWIENNLKSHS